MVLEIEPSDRQNQGASSSGRSNAATSHQDQTPSRIDDSSTTTTTTSSRRSWCDYFVSKSKLEWLFPTIWQDDRYKRIRYERIDDYRHGYPYFAAYTNSDPNFRVFRRFGTLRNRVILHRQHELVKLEQQLNELDEKDWAENPIKIQCIRKDQETAVSSAVADGQTGEANVGESERTKLINKIDSKLKDYDELLRREKESMALQKPTERNYMSLIHFLWNHKYIAQEEATFAEVKNDFVILASEQESWFHELFEDFVGLRGGKRLHNWLATPEQRQSTDSKWIRLVSQARVNALVQTIVTVITTTLFMFPIFLVTKLDLSFLKRLGINFGFIVVFIVVVRWISKPKMHEIFAMVAAYAAVLMVFVGGLSSGLGSSGTSQS